MSRALLLLLVGIGIGVLIAPGKGSETLNSLFGAAEDAEDYVTDKVDEAKSKAKKEKKILTD